MRPIVVTLFLFLAASATAQQVTVRAGEHEEFTRVVLRLPDNTDWTLGRVEEGYGLRFSRDLEINLDGFFSLIPKDRISDVELTDSQQIDFQLACDCYATASLTDTGWLVIDIGEDLILPESIYEMPLDSKEVEQLIELPLQERNEFEDDAELPSVVSVDNFNSSTTFDQIDVQALERRMEEEGRLNQIEDAVIASLGRAIEQGLLMPSETLDRSAESKNNDDALSSLIEDVGRSLGLGLEARTSIDQTSADNFNESKNEENCAKSEYFEVSNWGTDEAFAQQLARARQGLVGEFSRPDEQAVLNLSRLYLYFGFGREAKAIIDANNVQSVAHEAIIMLSNIIDGDDIEGQGFVENMMCPKPMHFWGAMASGDGPLPYEIKPEPFVQTFLELPSHLKRHLAPRAASLLRKAGLNDLARIVLDEVPAEGVIEVPAKIERSALLSLSEENESAISQLSAIVNEDARPSPEALMQLISKRLELGLPINDEEISILESYKFELTDPDLKRQLLDIELKIYLENRNFQSAFDAILEMVDYQNENYILNLREEIFEDIVKIGSDFEFLDFYFSEVLRSIRPETQNAISKRLLQLGFLSEAEREVALQTTGEAMIERRYIRAEIAGLRGDQDLLIAHLSGVESERASELRSNVRSSLPSRRTNDNDSSISNSILSNSLPNESPVLQADLQQSDAEIEQSLSSRESSIVDAAEQLRNEILQSLYN